MLKRLLKNHWLLMTAILALTAGCDDDDDSATGGTTGGGGETAGTLGGGGEATNEEIGETYTQPVTAAAGGTLATPSGSAKLTVPAGALAADTELTVAVEAASASTAAPIYDFGPDGLQFAQPVSLELAFTGTVPEGKKAVLALEENGTFTEVAGSSLANGKVTGQIQHFSRFSIILVNGQAVIQSECEEIFTSFSACGGDPTGTWNFQDFCMDSTAIGDDPFEGRCPGASLSLEMDVEGTVVFTADQVTTTWTRQVLNADVSVPKTCLGGAPNGCNDLFGESYTCSDAGDVCECASVQENELDPPETQGYRVEGNNLIFIDPEDGEEEAYELCIQGNTAKVKKAASTDEDGDVNPAVVYTLTR